MSRAFHGPGKIQFRQKFILPAFEGDIYATRFRVDGGEIPPKLVCLFYKVSRGWSFVLRRNVEFVGKDQAHGLSRRLACRFSGQDILYQGFFLFRRTFGINEILLRAG